MDLIISTILPFVLILVVLVVVHEAGHFFTAKMFGVSVLEFGIGYPPRLFAFKRGETEYSVNALPLGGFVRLLGEEESDDARSLTQQKAWKRLIILAAGAFMNFVLAVVIFAVALMIPREVSIGNAVIRQVVPGSPAQQAGLQSGDVIQKIGGRTIDNVSDASYNIRLHLGEQTPIVVRHTDPATGDATTKTVDVTPRWAPPTYDYTVKPGDTVDTVAQTTTYDRDAVRQAADIPTTLTAGQKLVFGSGEDETFYTTQQGDTVASVAQALRVSDKEVADAAGLPDPEALTPGMTLHFQQGATGITIGAQYPYTENRSLGVVPAFERGWQETWDSLKLARNGIISWIKGGTSAPVTGPIGIAQATGEIVKEAGWKSLMETAALLSMNLAVINILPLPFVDGGKIAFVLVEIARRGKRVAPAKEALVHFMGMVALLILVVVLSYFDVARIVRGDALLR